jgi:hypothetical protein
MRIFLPLLAGLGLLSTATAALAEPPAEAPAKLSEAELGQVAAGQALGSGFAISTMEALTNTTTTTTTTNTNDNDSATSMSNSVTTAAQDLAAGSTNSVNALGMLDSTGVTAAGNANAVLTGSIGNTVP